MKKELIMAATGVALLSGCETEKDQKKEVDQKLKEIKQTPTTNQIPVMADCYAMSILPDRVEKVDPDSGQKTLSVKPPQ
jgi:protein involved in sex pheromone biosynthesis